MPQSITTAGGHDRPMGIWFGVPSLPAAYLRRPRLIDILEGARGLPLVLVSAPAGSGKTSLVADWLAASDNGEHATWVTFEEADESLWPGLVEGLRSLGVEAGLPIGRAGPDRDLLTSLASEVAQQPGPLTLVVDGYELISMDVANDIDFLLRHSGHRLQLVVVTRVDPVLPLYRYRLEGTIAEIRMADLAFRDQEADQLLRSSGVELAPASVHALNVRTRGWAAGLRFAARMLVERDDPDAAIDDVAGDTGNIGEYLMGEVLDAQSPEVRQLLLHTSIPETLQPGLAEELGGRSATRTLAFLTRVNAFVEPVPQHPGFYRYHPFFRDLLRAELAYESPQRMVKLQRKAARWFAREGQLAPSVSHFASVGAWAEAAGQVVESREIGQLLVDKGESSLARSLSAMPVDLVGPAASVVRATLALAAGETDRCREALVPAPGVDGNEESSDPAISMAVAVLLAVRARYAEDPPGAVRLAAAAERALHDDAQRSGADPRPELVALVLASKAVATLRLGKVDKAGEAFKAGIAAGTAPGCEPLLVECLGFLALVSCVRGRLSRARGFAERAVAIAEKSVPAAERTSAAWVALAWVDVEQDDLRAAADHIKLAKKLDSVSGDPVSRTLLALVSARVQGAQGDLAGAIGVVERASSHICESDRWLADRLRLEAAQLRLANGEPEVAVLEVEAVGERSNAEVALVVAQLSMRQGRDGEVEDSLVRVLARGAPLKAQVAGWLLEVSRQLRQGSTARARSALERSLRLAAPESLRRPFREASPAVQQMMSRETQLVSANGWLSRRSDPRPTIPTARAVLSGQKQDERPARPPVVEDLTRKELEVLGHLAELETTEEIAAAMFVSVNTIRTHVRSILRKLGVSRRNAAVRRARELRLLAA